MSAVLQVEVPSGVNVLDITITDDHGRVVQSVAGVAVTPPRWRHVVKLAPGDNTITVGSGASLFASAVIKCNAKPIDERQQFDASVFAGVSVDSFAATDLNRYINPEQSGQVKERAIGGIDFAYRLSGNPYSKSGKQLWIYGETVHGVRSAGVDCTQDIPSSDPNGRGVCVNFSPGQNKALYIIRSATSLEGVVGVRWEFARLQAVPMAPISAYVKGQAGFLAVAGVGGDVVDMHHFAVGAISTAGKMKDSYIEVGIGKSDLFAIRKQPRLKIDAYLQFPLFGDWLTSHGLTGFAQMTIDSSWQRGGADSIQSYLGVNFDLGSLFH